jgi:hypothetical protein
MYFQGVQVPALGSPRDIVFRKYMTHQAKTEAAKHKLYLLQTIGTPMFSDEAASKRWTKKAGKFFDEYLALIFGVTEMAKAEEEEEERTEQELMEFYEQVVKPSKVKIRRDSSGALVATDLPKI